MSLSQEVEKARSVSLLWLPHHFTLTVNCKKLQDLSKVFLTTHEKHSQKSSVRRSKYYNSLKNIFCSESKGDGEETTKKEEKKCPQKLC